MEAREGEIVLRGQARNAKAGAVLLTERGGIYIAGLESWPAEAEGRQVEAVGRLQDDKLIPDPVNQRGELVAGAWGTQTMLRDARWRVIW